MDILKCALQHFVGDFSQTALWRSSQCFNITSRNHRCPQNRMSECFSSKNLSDFWHEQKSFLGSSVDLVHTFRKCTLCKKHFEEKGDYKQKNKCLCLLIKLF